MPKESHSFFRGKEVSAGGVGVAAGRETFPGKGLERGVTVRQGGKKGFVLRVMFYFNI